MPAAISAAQGAADFSTLHLKVGDTIYVTDEATGVEVSGSLRMLSPAQLSIDGYAFAPASHLKIERAGDPIWSGAAVGFSLGALIDRAHRGRTTVYKASSHAPGPSVQLVPDIGPRRKAVTLALGF